MYRLLHITIVLILSVSIVAGQSKIAEFDIPIKFSREKNVAGYILKDNSGYIINYEGKDQISRAKYDANYKLIDSYLAPTEYVSLDTKISYNTIFVTDLQLQSGNFEVYSSQRNVVVVAPDFQMKKDSILFDLNLTLHEEDEKRLAIIPFSKGLRVLSFSKKRDMLCVYEWNENGKSDTAEMPLPKSSLSADELKKYTKDARVKYKNSFEDMIVAPADSPSIISKSVVNSIYYSEDKIWLLCQTPLGTGYNLLELDLLTNTISCSNFMVNDMRQNASANAETRKIPYATVSGNTLIIRNSSNFSFEYFFYDLNTKEKIKEFQAGPDKSLRKLLHSDFNQRGTWLSANDDKTVNNEKAFLRKLSSSDGFITVSEQTKDSITITTGGLKVTNGMEGLIFGVATRIIGAMANIRIGNFQIIPYLALYRNKLSYCHTRFSASTYEMSSANNVTTPLDNVLDNFERRDLGSNSSFLFKKDNRYLVAVFNPEKDKFEVYNLTND